MKSMLRFPVCPRSSRGLLLLAGVLFASVSFTAHAAVTGRYIYFGNALSESMELAEFEVFCGGENVILNRPEVFTHGLEYSWYMMKRTPEQRLQAARMLVDGKLDISQRVSLGSAVGGGYLDIALYNTHLEVDLGTTKPIDSIAILRSRYTGKVYADLGWRVLVVLDAQRRVVSWEAFNVYGPEWKKNGGRWVFAPKPATGPPAGRVVPEGSRSWLSEAEFIRDFLGKPVVDLVQNQTPEDKARLERFRRRNDPAEVEKLGQRFFQRVDLNSPGLEEVRRLVQAKQYAAALAAFKEPFLARLEPLRDWNAGEGTSIYVFYTWTTESDTRYTCRSRDLRNQLQADREDLTVKRFIPGLLPPAKFTFPFQMRPLLLNYAVSKDVEDLRLWEAMTDDWALGFQEAADKDPQKLRDYFVLDPGIKANLKDLYQASQTNPKFVRELSGATLARFLLPILEEIPVANWRVARRVSFNHTFNCVPGGLQLAQLLDEFYAGQRLGREMQQAFERLYTYNQYRDGSMVEIGDEGHYLAPVWSPANLYGIFAHRGRPAWFTPALETYFLDNYRANLLSQVRNLSPCGAHVRWNPNVDRLNYLEYELGIKDPYWRNGSGSRMAWGDYYPTLCLPVLEEPTPRAFIDTVYGRGRPPFEERNKKREQEAVAKVFGGEYQGAPAVLSDWMPYSGLWYFRGGWDREASFLHMVKPALANNLGGGCLYPLTNAYGHEQFNTTSYRFHDYATPLLTCLGTLIDDLPPCPQERLVPSGSKQENFTRAVEKPQPSRWYTDAELDFGEALYRGNYRVAELAWDPKLHKSVPHFSPELVENVSTARQLFQVRPARLFLQVDRLRYADPNETHRNTLNNALILLQPGEGDDQEISDDQLVVLPKDNRITTHNPGNAGVTVAWFGQPELEVERSGRDLRHPSFGKLGGPSVTLNGYRKTLGREVLTSWDATGESVLLSVLRAHRPGADPLTELQDLSTDSVAGVCVKTTDGVSASLLVARRIPAALGAGPVHIEGEALLVVERPGKPVCGMALGVRQFRLDGEVHPPEVGDFKFSLDNGLQRQPIRRPLDPPTIEPAVNVFSDSTRVTITSASPDVDLFYIAESMPPSNEAGPVDPSARASVNATNWVRYTGPFTITESTFVRARAFRKGVTHVPFTAAGTDVSALSYGFFHRRAPKPAVAQPAALKSGLDYDYLEDRWFALWTYTDQLDAKATGITPHLLDVSMRATDGPFAVRYRGYLQVPQTGVYTFYGPEEYVNNLCEPGYDLRLFIDEEEWYLGQTWHGLGAWSIPLQKGLHRFRVTFADARAKDLETQRIDLWRHYPWPETTWRGTAPVIEVSGPGLKRQPIPAAWLKRGVGAGGGQANATNQGK